MLSKSHITSIIFTAIKGCNSRVASGCEWSARAAFWEGKRNASHPCPASSQLVWKSQVRDVDEQSEQLVDNFHNYLKWKY